MEYALFILIRRIVRLAVLAILLASSAACTVAPTFTVAVDSIAASPVSGSPQRYVLKPVVAGVDSGDLRFQTYAAHIHRALEAMAFVQASDADRADIEIEVNYGAVRDEKTLVTPRLRSLERPRRHCRHRDAGGKCRAWQIGGLHHDGFGQYLDEIRVVPYYRVFIALEAFAIAESRRTALWSTRARADTAGPDLRVALPLLLTAASDHIGTDTGREIAVVLDRGDIESNASGS